MKKIKRYLIPIMLIIASIICSQLSSIFANTNYANNDKLTYKELTNDETLISGFDVGTNLKEIKSNYFETKYNIKIFDKNDNEITNSENKKIATGNNIKIYLNDELEKECIVVIYGDVSGDGAVSAVDALAVIKNNLGTIPLKSEEYIEAGRITNDTRTNNKKPSSVDALSIVKYKLDPENCPISQKLIQKEETEQPENPETSTPVSLHGKLKVNGTKIVDKNEDIFQLKGISTHGIAWFPQYVNRDTFEYMRDEWGINVIRLAMYSNPNDGYTRENWNLVKNGINYATDLGLYVIIDWHILNDNNPNTYKSEAIEFFKEMATTYKNNENVLYEICNEPNGDVTWERDIKPYSEEVISEIRKIDNDAIIICGTPTWSQDVDIVSQNPITDYENIMYTLHFYAATHKEDLRNKLTTALNNGLPIFVSEFGICDASGNGAIDKTEANRWISTLNENDISWVCWNLSNKNESSAILSSSTNKLKDWTEEELSQSGKWLKEALKLPNTSDQ